MHHHLPLPPLHQHMVQEGVRREGSTGAMPLHHHLPLPPLHQHMVQEGVSKEGSNLSGVSATCAWEDADGRPGTGLVNTDLDTLGNGLLQPPQGTAEIELMSIRPLEYVHIKLNLEAANVLPLAIQ